VLYQSAYPDVTAAGVDPLAHFDQIGWREGRIPSLAFSPAQYRAANRMLRRPVSIRCRIISSSASRKGGCLSRRAS
jgi:hypothetical protein